MAKKNKFSLDFKNFEDYAEKLDKLGGDLKDTAGEALRKSYEYVTNNLEPAINKHRETGKTEKSLLKNSKVTWTGNTASIDVGFDINNGGLPSIFLMYGTPRHGPVGAKGGHPGTQADKQLYNAIYGSSAKRKIRELQEEVFAKEVKKIMGG